MPPLPLPIPMGFAVTTLQICELRFHHIGFQINSNIQLGLKFMGTEVPTPTFLFGINFVWNFIIDK